MPRWGKCCYVFSNLLSNGWERSRAWSPGYEQLHSVPHHTPVACLPLSLGVLLLPQRSGCYQRRVLSSGEPRRFPSITSSTCQVSVPGQKEAEEIWPVALKCSGATGWAPMYLILCRKCRRKGWLGWVAFPASRISSQIINWWEQVEQDFVGAQADRIPASRAPRGLALLFTTSGCWALPPPHSSEAERMEFQCSVRRSHRRPVGLHSSGIPQIAASCWIQLLRASVAETAGWNLMVSTARFRGRDRTPPPGQPLWPGGVVTMHEHPPWLPKKGIFSPQN